MSDMTEDLDEAMRIGRFTDEMLDRAIAEGERELAENDDRESALILNTVRELRSLRDTAHARSSEQVDGVALIRAERQRQITAEGWTPKHDDGHRYGEMAITAACYAANETDARVLVNDDDAFPFGTCDDKRKKHPRLRQLAIAGALIAAEIDRLRRAGVESAP